MYIETRKLNAKGEEGEKYLLLQNLRINYMESHYLRDGD